MSLEPTLIPDSYSIENDSLLGMTKISNHVKMFTQNCSGNLEKQERKLDSFYRLAKNDPAEQIINGPCLKQDPISKSSQFHQPKSKWFQGQSGQAKACRAELFSQPKRSEPRAMLTMFEIPGIA